ncbi:MAG: aminotransferase class I/II-fold pyridoxal phosphate-dependent enzyme, partial [Treponema sp.]|nr:aminotransferase class I/II-fold pyridoxal phosphate-dependent enzyme [Treponema sp.]
MNPLAKSLNDALEGTAAGRLLSGLGRELYFPKGIIAQGAQAKKAASFANGTIGMAYSGGKPLILSALADCAPELSADEIVAYAPTAGTEKAREAWKKALLKKNPSLETLGFSMPAVTAGLTSGLSCVADLFFGAGDVALASGPCWDNYDLIFETRRQARLSRVPFFAPDAGAGSGLDIAGIRAAILESAKSGSARIVFNFPNNPAGYSPGAREAGELAGIVREAAEGGADVLVICDDAYFGLFYEDGIDAESLFVKFAGLHERVLA